VDFLCLTGGSDYQMKLWDLRQRKCVRDYGADDEELQTEPDEFHTDSIWDIKANSTFDSCFTGGRDGKIFHTDLAGDNHTLIFHDKESQIIQLTYDEEN